MIWKTFYLGLAIMVLSNVSDYRDTTGPFFALFMLALGFYNLYLFFKEQDKG